MKKSVIVLFTTVFIICIMWFSSPVYKSLDTIYVSTVFPHKKDIYDSVISKGTIEAGKSKEIYLSTTSMIDSVYVEIGDFVKAGDALIEVTPTNNIIDTGVVEEIVPELSNIDLGTVETLLDKYKIDANEYLQSIVTFNGNKETQEPIVISPMEGVVTQLNAAEGEACSSYKAAVVVSDLNDINVRVQVPELYIDRIKEGQDVEITGDAFSKKYSGKVKKIYPTAMRKSSITGVGETTVDTIVSINNPDLSLKPGFTVTTKIYTKKKTDVFTLPYNCIFQEGEREYVYVTDNGIATKKQVSTGLELNDEVEITFGLKGADKVIISPSEKVKDGASVAEKR